MDDMQIKVDFVVHEKTGLIVAVSDQLKGLYVHGRSLAEVEARLPSGIRALLEAEGRSVRGVAPQQETVLKAKPRFVSPRNVRDSRMYEAALCVA